MLLYKQITWWPDAFHVFNGSMDPKARIGIVNRRVIHFNGKRVNGKWLNGNLDRVVWFANNVNFFEIRGEFATRAEAAAAIPTGPIHQHVDAFSR